MAEQLRERVRFFKVRATLGNSLISEAWDRKAAFALYTVLCKGCHWVDLYATGMIHERVCPMHGDCAICVPLAVCHDGSCGLWQEVKQHVPHIPHSTPSCRRRLAGILTSGLFPSPSGWTASTLLKPSWWRGHALPLCQLTRNGSRKKFNVELQFVRLHALCPLLPDVSMAWKIWHACIPWCLV